MPSQAEPSFATTSKPWQVGKPSPSFGPIRRRYKCQHWSANLTRPGSGTNRGKRPYRKMSKPTMTDSAGET